jgi:hypothetical protein
MPAREDPETAQLRKLEAAYRLCCKKLEELDKQPKKKRGSNTTERRSSSRDSKNRPLNGYQRHVREEFSKSEYKGMAPAQRMKAVSQAWKAKK